jgi:hypothetical protein
MTNYKFILNTFLTIILFSTITQAQATRTWISGVGDDVNPCSRTAPCKTFAGAISKTAAGGEINALDPGGFGAVTITKSVTIDATNTKGSILSSGGINGVVINAGANDVVILRGLDINGAGTGLNGIRFIAGKALHVENCKIYGVTGDGIKIETANEARISIKETIIKSASNGINIAASGTGVINALVDKSHIEGSKTAVLAGNGSRITISNSVLSMSGTGIMSEAAKGASEITIEKSTVANNDVGIMTASASSIVRLSNTMVTNNNKGLVASSGSIISFKNNVISGNGKDGTPTTSSAGQ